MLRSLPVKDPSQLVLLGEGDTTGITDDFARTNLYSYPFYRQMQQQNQVFSDTAAIFSITSGGHGVVEGRTESEPMSVQLVSGTYFQTLGVRALMGRILNDADDNSEGDHPVAVISYAWWKRSLAQDPNVLNRKLKLGATICNIIGVAPPEFFGTVSTVILFGTIPAIRATNIQLTDALKDGRGPQAAGARNPLARALVVSQVALSLVLMVGAGLFVRSLVNLNDIDTGFNKENVLRLEIDSSSAGYTPGEAREVALDQQIEEHVSALPGVKAASFSAFTFHEGSWSSTVLVPETNIGKDINVKHNVIGNGYFATMQIPLLAGRNFSTSDMSSSKHVAIISEHLAKTLFPLGNPIGRHYGLGGDKPEDDVTVIGLAKDVKFGHLTEEPVNLDCVPYTQHPWGFGDFEVRYTGSFAPITAAVQQTIHSIDRSLPITGVTTLDEQIARTLTDQRLVAQLSTFFGLLAIFLASIGIYGLMSYVISRRTNEIGIRMALGAARANVRWLVMREILFVYGRYRRSDRHPGGSCGRPPRSEHALRRQEYRSCQPAHRGGAPACRRGLRPATSQQEEPPERPHGSSTLRITRRDSPFEQTISKPSHLFCIGKKGSAARG